MTCDWRRRRGEMRKVIGIAVVVAVVVAVVRWFGPALKERAMAKRRETFGRPPDERALATEREDVVPVTAG